MELRDNIIVIYFLMSQFLMKTQTTALKNLLARYYKKPFVKFLLLLVVFGFFNWALTLTYYNPAVIVPAYGWAKAHGIDIEIDSVHKFFSFGDEEGYPLLSIDKINRSLFFGPRAAVIGKVTYIVGMADGDWHINVADDKDNIIVAEIIPEYPLPIPPLGAMIKIWGITRYDLAHRWWELHPVIGWEAQR